MRISKKSIALTNRYLGDIIPVIESASKRMLPDERVKEVLDNLNLAFDVGGNYLRRNPGLRRHTTFMAARGAIGHLREVYSDERYAKGLDARSFVGSPHQNAIGPFIDYLKWLKEVM